MGTLAARATIVAGVMVVVISPPLGVAPLHAIAGGAALLMLGGWGPLTRWLHLALACSIALWTPWGMFEGWLGVALAAEILMMRALFAGESWSEGARGIAVSLALFAMLATTLALELRLSRAATLTTGPLLSVQGGGSIAIDPGDAEAVQLVLPPSLAFVPDGREAEALGLEDSMDLRGLATRLQLELRAAAPEMRGELRSPRAAFRHAQLASARVERVGAAGDRLRFVSGHVEPGLRWRFVCPGGTLGPGPIAPDREPDPDGARALCPDKYAAPLVAALGAHPALVSEAPEPGSRLLGSLGFGVRQLMGGFVAVLTLLLAGLEARRGEVRAGPIGGLITLGCALVWVGGVVLAWFWGWPESSSARSLAAAWWYLALGPELLTWELGVELARIWLVLAALRHALGVAKIAAPVVRARTSQGVSEQRGGR